MAKQLKRPRDPNQLAKMITDIATGEIADADDCAGKDPAAVARGKAGGAKGGPARAASLSPQDRHLAAQKAAQARWAQK